MYQYYGGNEPAHSNLHGMRHQSRQQQRNPRASVPDKAVTLELFEKDDHFEVVLDASEGKLSDISASIEGSTLYIEGSYKNVEQEVVFHTAARAYESPCGPSIGVIRTGTMARAGISMGDWLCLNDGEAWVYGCSNTLEAVRSARWSCATTFSRVCKAGSSHTGRGTGRTIDHDFGGCRVNLPYQLVLGISFITLKRNQTKWDQVMI